MTQVLDKPNAADFPPNFNYWEDFAPDNPNSPKIDSTIRAIATTALGYTQLHSDTKPALIEQAPPLQAEAGYRLVGPLQDFYGKTDFLDRTVKVMEARPVFGEEAAAELKLDIAYVLEDIVFNSLDFNVCKDTLRRALIQVSEIESSANFKKRPAIYQLQTAILKNDLEQAGVRLMLTGSVQPQPLEVSKQQHNYRTFEKAFAELDKSAISRFKKLVEGGISETNVGILLEWYFILSRRHEAWADETLDTVSVRGSTSRENRAAWQATDGVNYFAPKAHNHDVVISTYRKDRDPQVDRIQLKANDNKRKTEQYDRSYITVIDVSTVLGSGENNNLDSIVKRMVNNLDTYARDYSAK